ncbi:MAG: hypothetical protein LH609_21240 [Rudanella sp.]|nr:hypothetical protein [Rudanella sp.]
MATYNGNTRYAYIPVTDAQDYFLSVANGYPIYSPVISQDWKRGKLTSTSVLTASAGNKFLSGPGRGG